MSLGRYRHYGLVVASDVALPNLAETSVAELPDVAVSIELRAEHPAPGPPWEPVRPGLWRDGERLRVHLEGSGEWADFEVGPGGRELTVRASAGVPAEHVAELVAGPVFSVLLTHRGQCALHASVVRFHGQTIAVTGPAAAGKSTLALALVRRGAQLVADDVAALQVGPEIRLAAGPSRLRLRRDVAAGLPGPELAEVAAREDKRYLPVDAAQGLTFVLDVIAMLEPRGPEGAPRRLTGPEALVRLMAERHAAAFRTPDADRADFAALGTVAQRVPVYAVPRRDGLDAVDEAVTAIAGLLCTPA